VIERYGAVPLQKLTTTDVENLVDAMLTSGRKRGGKPGTALSPRTVQLTLPRLRSALTDAQRRHLVEWNVAAPVKCPSQVKTQREPWTEHEYGNPHIADRAAAARGDAAFPARTKTSRGMWGVLAGYRCRLRTLKVTSTRTRVATNDGMLVVEKGPKSVSGRRVLPLPAQVTAALGGFCLNRLESSSPPAAPIRQPVMCSSTGSGRRSAPTGYGVGLTS
jgi:hypothetical protein